MDIFARIKRPVTQHWLAFIGIAMLIYSLTCITGIYMRRNFELSKTVAESFME